MAPRASPAVGTARGTEEAATVSSSGWGSTGFSPVWQTLSMHDKGEITRLLDKWAAQGDEGLNELVPLVFEELHRLADHHLARVGPMPTLQPTALVNEAYLRFKSSQIRGFADRVHFFAFASQVIRGVLVDHARARQTRKRGGEEARVPLSEALGVRSGLDIETVLGLDQALTRLEASHPRQSRVLELHLFGGLTLDEITEVLELSRSTVERDWALGRRRLARELQDS